MVDDLKTNQNSGKLHFLLAESCSLLLAFLFAYTAVSKVYDWKGTQLAMYNQVIPDWTKELLLFGIPTIEFAVCLFLWVPAWRKLGFQVSTLMMTFFSGYVLWVWLGLAGRIPCSCGGVISSLSWGEHLIFNLAFLGISVLGLKSHKKIKLIAD